MTNGQATRGAVDYEDRPDKLISRAVDYLIKMGLASMALFSRSFTALGRASNS